MKTLTLRLILAGTSIETHLLEGVSVLASETTPGAGSLDPAEFRRILASTNPSPDVPALGKRLGEFLLPGRVQTEWRRLAAAGPVRTMCEIDAALAMLPWELASAQDRLFLRDRTPFVRAANGVSPSAVREWPLRLLVILAASDTELSLLQGDQEHLSIRHLLHDCNRSFLVRTLRQPSRGQIVDELRKRPHILHFVGHGEAKGLLLYVKGEGASPWTEQAIRTDLGSAQFSPPLVYLNACRSLGGADTPLGMSQLSRAFFDNGSRAVIAMHGDVSGPRSAACAVEFYKTIAADGDVDVALARARAAIDRYDATNEPGVSEFCHAYLPALMVSGPPEAVLPRCKDVCAAAPRGKVQEWELNRIVHDLVNHEEPRTGLLCAVGAGEATRNVMLVVGKESTGKSWLLGWCIDGWLRRDRAVRYAAMAQASNWLDAMHLILRGDKAFGAIGAPLPAALAAFEDSLRGLARAKKVVGKAKFDLAKIDLTKLDQGAAGQAFADSLRLHTAAGGPLLLVLDQFTAPTTAMSAVDFKALWDNWIEPHVVNGDGSVRLVAGVRQEDLDNKRYVIPTEMVHPFEVGPFDEEHCLELIEEILWARHRDQFEPLRASVRSELEGLPPEAMTAAELVNRADLVFKIAKWRSKGQR